MPKLRKKDEGGFFYIKSRGLYRVTVDFGINADGKRDQRSKYSRTEAGARVKLEQMKEEKAKYGKLLDRTTTLREWSDHWLQNVQKPNLKPNSLAASESVTRTWILPTLGKKRVVEIKPSDVLLVHRRVLNAGKSTATARKVHDVLSGMLESARMEGLAERNVADDVKPPKVLTKERGALSTNQALAVLGAAAAIEDGTRWWVALLAGLRQSERLGARLDSLDLENGYLDVEWALDEIPSEHGCGEKDETWPCGKERAGACPKRRLKIPDGFEYIHLHGRLALIRPKSGKARRVPLIPQLAEALRRYVIATADRPNPYGLIWRKANGEPYLPGEDGEAWRDLLLAAGVITEEQWKAPKKDSDVPTTHWARHTTATVMMELGIDTKVIGEIVGHVDVKTTRRYQHVSSEAARSAMSSLGAHWVKALGKDQH